VKRRHLIPIFLALPAAFFQFSEGCNAQGEGQLCNPLNNGNDDCQAPLICTTNGMFHVCCLPVGSVVAACVGFNPNITTSSSTTTTTSSSAGGTGGTGGTGGAGGAGGQSTVCVPGTSIDCPQAGCTSTCRANGSGFDPCVCTDGGTDAGPG
jgi:hypothetical protein